MKMNKKLICIITIIGMLISGCSSKPNNSKEINGDTEVMEKQKVEISSQNGEQITLINNIESKKLERSLEKFKVIKKVANRKRVGIVKPVTRIVVGKDFLIDKIEANNDIDVNDPGAKSQWALTYTNSNDIWDFIEQKQTVNIAVIDTGVDYNHPDLKNRVKQDMGYDFVNDDGDAMDDNGHGTHVAGIISAEANNEEGIVGVVGNLDVNVIPIKVLDKDGVGYSDTIAKGIEYAVEKGADIINLSLGGTERDEDIEKAVSNALDKGVLVIAAAGNDKRNCDEYTPAGVNGVYTIAASNLLNRTARFSNFGKSVDITAPGTKILSTVPNGGYEAWDGTSMAAPVVSGIAAMLKAHDPSIDSIKIKEILQTSSKDIMKDGEDVLSGYGLIDSKEAFEILTGSEVEE
ncbi:S8 family peptidase [Wukongibacter baidiensis]|uniref:S8 family peptidase n=1 Tax=Wukongibacter baidiensis TaxID=1723361 RepID=UPI003D7F740E